MKLNACIVLCFVYNSTYFAADALLKFMMFNIFVKD